MRDNKTYALHAQEVLEDPKKLAAYIDHTLLKPDARLVEIEKLCDEAIQHSFKAVCVNSDRVTLAHSRLKNTKILVASVVGFPFGSHMSFAKARETELAIAAGANEIDMVLNIGWLKDKLLTEVAFDIRGVVAAAGTKHNVKVILETGLLNVEEIRTACKICEDSGAHFVKTSTGFLGRGASLDDVRLMFQNVSANMEIKASGGIRDLKFACDLLAAGATRIGTSSGVQLVQAQKATGDY